MRWGSEGYTGGMTAKERLREWVEELDEEDAAEALLLLENAADPGRPLTPAQRASIERGLAQAAEGRGIPHDEVFRRLGIDD